MSEIDLINYYKNTVQRLQQECTEKTDAIIFLGEQLNHYKQVVKEIKEIAENNMDDKQIIAVQTMLNGSPDAKNEVLKQIIQKCEELEK